MKAIALIVALMATPLAAQVPTQMQCGPTDDVYAALTDKFGETRQIWAQYGQTQVIEFWAGADGWTIIMTMPDGSSCLMADGRDWGMMPNEEKPQL